MYPPTPWQEMGERQAHKKSTKKKRESEFVEGLEQYRDVQ